MDYWGSGWNTGADPDGVASRLSTFVSVVGGSNWLDTITQYYGEATEAGPSPAPLPSFDPHPSPIQMANIANPTGILAGTYYDTRDVSATPSPQEIAGEALRAAYHFNDPTGIYLVATAKNVLPPGFGTQWCGYHGDAGGTVNDGTGATPESAYFIYMPYLPNTPTCRPTGTGSLYSVSIVAGHEIAEAITDPETPTGPKPGWSTGSPYWYEIGDLCEWQNLKTLWFSGNAFAVQPLWSNAANSCVISN